MTDPVVTAVKADETSLVTKIKAHIVAVAAGGGFFAGLVIMYLLKK